ncbi:RNA-directed DNA polymerase, eukaryota, partial [Tanacetum coccineum]
RNVRGGAEQSQFDALSNAMKEVALVPMSDRYVWSLNGSEDFSVASIRKVIDDSYLPSISSRTRWIKNVPIKVNILTWKIKMDALPTRFNLSRRGIDIESISCPICDCGVETSSHLFFRCSLSRQIVSKILLWWDVPYVEVESYAEWLEWLGSVRMLASLKLMFEGVFSVFWWLLWIFRNKTVFETSSPSKSILFDDVVSSSFHWRRSRSNFKFSREECTFTMEEIDAIGFGQIEISCIKFLNYYASLLTAANATNSYSIVEPVMHVCFLEAHEMVPPSSRNTHPLVENESST